jgi:hypothetical protein
LTAALVRAEGVKYRCGRFGQVWIVASARRQCRGFASVSAPTWSGHWHFLSFPGLDDYSSIRGALCCSGSALGRLGAVGGGRQLPRHKPTDVAAFLVDAHASCVCRLVVCQVGRGKEVGCDAMRWDRGYSGPGLVVRLGTRHSFTRHPPHPCALGPGPAAVPPPLSPLLPKSLLEEQQVQTRGSGRCASECRGRRRALNRRQRIYLAACTRCELCGGWWPRSSRPLSTGQSHRRWAVGRIPGSWFLVLLLAPTTSPALHLTNGKPTGGVPSRYPPRPDAAAASSAQDSGASSKRVHGPPIPPSQASSRLSVSPSRRRSLSERPFRSAAPLEHGGCHVLAPHSDSLTIPDRGHGGWPCPGVDHFDLRTDGNYSLAVRSLPCPGVLLYPRATLRPQATHPGLVNLWWPLALFRLLCSRRAS